MESTCAIRMPDKRLPMKVFYGKLQKGKRSQGGQKKRYNDTLKSSLKDFDIPVGSWRSDQSGELSSTKDKLSMKKVNLQSCKRSERKANTNIPPHQLP